MRYLHDQAGEIVRHTKDNRFRLFKCSQDAAIAPTEEGPELIEEMLEKSETLWGTFLPYYAIASRSPEVARMTLEEAVSNVESVPSPDKFVVAAYVDGGLITVS